MAYKTKDLLDRAIKILKDDPNVVFIEEVSHLIGVSKKTFYAHKLHESNAIIDLLWKNKTGVKKILRMKMVTSDNPAAWRDLYKLCSSDDEWGRLANSNHKINADHKHEIIIKDGTEFGLP